MTTLSGTLYVGGVAVNGSLWLEVSQQAVGAGGANVTPSAPYVFSLANGQISGPGSAPYTVPGNDTLTPANTWYFVTVFGSSGEQLTRGQVSITGASADIGAWAQASTGVFVPPQGYAVALIGDANGTSTANTVTKIRGKAVEAPPWTPGEVMTVQPDGSLGFDPPTGGSSTGVPSSTVASETSFGQSAAAGSSSTYSRGDHTHGTPALPSLGDLGAAAATHLHALADVNFAASDRIGGRASAGPGAGEEIVCTAAGRALLDDADAAAQRTTLGAAAATHTHAEADVSGLVADLAAKAPLASPALTGTPTAPTATPGTNTTQVATTAFVQDAVAGVSGGGTPSATVTSETAFGQSAAAGSSSTYSRGDHTHGTPAAPTPASIGAAPASHTQAATTLTFAATDRLAGRASAGAGAGEEIVCTAAGRALLDDADAAAQRTTLGAAAASHTQAVSTVTFAATDRLAGRSSAGAGAGEEITCTAAGRALLDDADAAAQRTTLGLGSAALLSEASLRSIPQNSQTAAYVLVVGDVGKHISITTGGVTVNASVFSAGDPVTIFNNSGSAQTITQGTNVTLRLAGTATTGNRTLAQYGVCTLLCVVGGANPVFAISGAGLS